MGFFASVASLLLFESSGIGIIDAATAAYFERMKVKGDFSKVETLVHSESRAVDFSFNLS